MVSVFWSSGIGVPCWVVIRDGAPVVDFVGGEFGVDFDSDFDGALRLDMGVSIPRFVTLIPPFRIAGNVVPMVHPTFTRPFAGVHLRAAIGETGNE